MFSGLVGAQSLSVCGNLEGTSIPPLERCSLPGKISGHPCAAARGTLSLFPCARVEICTIGGNAS